MQTLFLHSLLSAFMMLHDIHVSVWEVNLVEDKVEITLKTFLDDLQLAVGLRPGEEIPEGYTSAAELIQNYISRSTHLMIGDDKLDLSVGQLDASQDAVWITITSTLPKSAVNEIIMSSSYMTELYNDQTNIVNIRSKYSSKATYTLSTRNTRIHHAF